MICEYGCKQQAKYHFINGKYCCSKNYQSCPAIREKNSNGVYKAHKEGRIPHSQLDGHRGWSKGKTAISDPRIRCKYDPNNLFVKGNDLGSGYLRGIIIKEGLLEYKCKICGSVEWRGKPLTLDLDHINSDRTDNRISNLRFLCPNCHSQTKGFRGKKSTGKKKVSTEEIINALLSSKSFGEVFSKLGLLNVKNNKSRIVKIISDYKLNIEH